MKQSIKIQKNSLYGNIGKFKKTETKCLHEQCTDCNGSGKKEDGSTCVHYISCPCPKCTPTY